MRTALAPHTTGPHDADDVHRERLDPFCLPDDRLAILLRRAPWRRVVVLGDSIAEGLGDPAPGYRDQSWAERLVGALESAVGPVDSLNFGRRGRRAGEILEYQVPQAVSFDPDLVVVTAGANDILQRSFEPARVMEEIDRILDRVTSGGALAVTFGLFDLSRVADLPDEARDRLGRRIRELNAVTERLAARHDAVHVDFESHPALDRSLFSSDLIHPNRRGHAYIASDVVRALSLRA
ncbi:SGNH/GDSL hydrolase family protein [Microbacterium sp. CPCC 204701]|uniref:SGNH/GDSL hydrolase family protein n=1 Tax=Microbacterium sp. CPCC 204701 TaxID=2493084 RepID=UPI000FDB5056|nr:SGNH/GDSL hydrolase family protein [Microbacterium sp. CPCC 204701]